MNRLALHMIVVMVLVTTISGLVLSGVWSVSVDKIKRNETIKIEQALKELSPDTDHFSLVTKGESSVYECYNENNQLISYFFLAEANGFQALIKVAAAVDPGWISLIGLRVLEQSETPGLGNKIVETGFTNKFAALRIQRLSPFSCIKNTASKSKGEIKAITGATISSKAVVSLLNNKIIQLRKAGF
ncbi:FMN-binding protein [Thermoproteota archaeon]